MDPIEKLSQLFKEFPGIGPRQARRFVYFLMTKNRGYTDELVRLIQNISKEIITCARCFRFFPLNIKLQSNECSICRTTNRDASLLMIVSKDVDMDAIEKSKEYNGLYFVLGGNVPILDKEPHTKIRSQALSERITRDVASGVLKEIILSLNATAEGEHTGDYVRSLLKPLIDKSVVPVKITVLGRGLSTGSELEYSDSETIRSALAGRK
jgi:recombination protein RecR